MMDITATLLQVRRILTKQKRKHRRNPDCRDPYRERQAVWDLAELKVCDEHLRGLVKSAGSRVAQLDALIIQRDAMERGTTTSWYGYREPLVAVPVLLLADVLLEDVYFDDGQTDSCNYWDHSLPLSGEELELCRWFAGAYGRMRAEPYWTYPQWRVLIDGLLAGGSHTLRYTVEVVERVSGGGGVLIVDPRRKGVTRSTLQGLVVRLATACQMPFSVACKVSCMSAAVDKQLGPEPLGPNDPIPALVSCMVWAPQGSEVLVVDEADDYGHGWWRAASPPPLKEGEEQARVVETEETETGTESGAMETETIRWVVRGVKRESEAFLGEGDGEPEAKARRRTALR